MNTDRNNHVVQITTTAPYPRGTSVDILEDDRVWIRRAGVLPVVTADEFRRTLEAFKEDPMMRIALMLLGFQVMRPVEVTRLRWADLRWDDSRHEFTKIRHLVYKPRRRDHGKSRSFFFKELEKDVSSRALSDELVALFDKFGSFPDDEPRFGRHPVRESGSNDHISSVAGKVFPWNHQEAVSKRWRVMRKKISTGIKRGTIGEEYAFLFEKRLERVHREFGAMENGALHRITPYSFRRFGMTWRYYMEFDRDMVALSRWSGHENPETTAGYVMPKEAIGLTDEMIENRISVDEFVFRGARRQATIPQYEAQRNVQFIPAGQSNLRDFEPQGVRNDGS